MLLSQGLQILQPNRCIILIQQEQEFEWPRFKFNTIQERLYNTIELLLSYTRSLWIIIGVLLRGLIYSLCFTCIIQPVAASKLILIIYYHYFN